jgi:hypothetical protein
VAIGDPAYDLAIITRGQRRPFKLIDGRAKLVAAYRSFGGVVTEEEVRVHEVCLVASWLESALAKHDVHETELHRHALRRLLGP